MTITKISVYANETRRSQHHLQLIFSLHEHQAYLTKPVETPYSLHTNFLSITCQFCAPNKRSGYFRVEIMGSTRAKDTQNPEKPHFLTESLYESAQPREKPEPPAAHQANKFVSIFFFIFV